MKKLKLALFALGLIAVCAALLYKFWPPVPGLAESAELVDEANVARRMCDKAAVLLWRESLGDDKLQKLSIRGISVMVPQNQRDAWEHCRKIQKLLTTAGMTKVKVSASAKATLEHAQGRLRLIRRDCIERMLDDTLPSLDEKFNALNDACVELEALHARINTLEKLADGNDDDIDRELKKANAGIKKIDVKRGNAKSGLIGRKNSLESQIAGLNDKAAQAMSSASQLQSQYILAEGKVAGVLQEQALANKLLATKASQDASRCQGELDLVLADLTSLKMARAAAEEIIATVEQNRQSRRTNRKPSQKRLLSVEDQLGKAPAKLKAMSADLLKTCDIAARLANAARTENNFAASNFRAAAGGFEASGAMAARQGECFMDWAQVLMKGHDLAKKTRNVADKLTGAWALAKLDGDAPYAKEMLEFAEKMSRNEEDAKKKLVEAISKFQQARNAGGKNRNIYACQAYAAVQYKFRLTGDAKDKELLDKLKMDIKGPLAESLLKSGD